MKATCIAGVVVSLAVWSAAAHANPKNDACMDSAVHGLALRDKQEWLEAREKFRACSNVECPAGVQKDCTTWLRQIEDTLPRIVLSARDDAGHDVTDVRVSIDGAPVATRLDGLPIGVNPGAHLVAFEFVDGSVAQQQVILAAGEKEHRVAVVRPGAAPLPSTGSPASTAPTPPLPEPAPAPSSASTAPAASVPVAPAPASAQAQPAMLTDGEEGAGAGGAQRFLGLALGGVGVAGLIAGGVFGVVATSTWSSAQSDCKPSACGAGSQAQNERSDALSAATASTVALIGGGAALAAGAILLFTAPRRQRESSGRLVVAPAVGSATGGVVFMGVFQ